VPAILFGLESTQKVMTETAIQNEALICSGGFHIEIHPDELTVTQDRTAFQPKKKTALGAIIKSVIAVFFIFYVLIILLPRISDDLFGFVAACALIIIPGVAWSLFHGVKNLHATCDLLEILQVTRGNVRNRWQYPKDSVKGICFAPVSYSRYGTTCGLVFKAQGKKVKILEGLESPEAKTILEQLERLGFDVVHDVAMSMMAEMALERRNSVFNQ